MTADVVAARPAAGATPAEADAGGVPPGHGPVRVRLDLLVALVAVVVTASGLLVAAVFSTPSTVKYVFTLTLLVGAACMLLHRQPLMDLVAVTVVCAPMALLTVSFGELRFKLLGVLLYLTAGLLVIGTGRRVGRTATGAALPVVLALLIVPAGIGEHRKGAVTVLVGAAALAWFTARVAVTGPRGQAWILGSFTVMATCQSLVALVQYRSGDAFDFYSGQAAERGADYFFRYSGENRSTGTFDDPLSLGSVLALSLPLVLVLTIRLVQQRRIRLAALTAMAALVVSAGLVTTLSRMSWLACAAGLVVTVVCLPRSMKLGMIAGLATAAAAAIPVATSLAGPAFGERIGSILHPTGLGVSTADGDEVRMSLWRFALQTWSDHPVTGVGLGDLPWLLQDQAATTGHFHAHSTYLQLAAEGGVLAVAALAVLVLAVGRDVGPAFRRDPVLTAGVAGCLVVVLLSGVTDTVQLMQQGVAALSAAAVGLLLGIRNQGRSARYVTVRDGGAVDGGARTTATVGGARA